MDRIAPRFERTLLVVLNDNSVTGISGVVNFLTGYFWVGCAPVILITIVESRKVRIFARLDRLAHRTPLLIALLFFEGTLVAHWALDGFEGLNPSGGNRIGALYRLVGYGIGSVAGLLVVSNWADKAGAAAH